MFVIGQRSGKNQTDRPELRETYRTLLVHFENLQQALNQGSPIGRSQIDPPMNQSRTLPPVQQLRAEGRLHELPIADWLERVERRALDYASSLYIVIEKAVFYQTVELLEAMTTGGVIKQGNVVFGTPTGQGARFFRESLSSVLFEDHLREVCERLDRAAKDDIGVRLTFMGNSSIREQEITVMPQYLGSHTAADFVRELRRRAVEHPEVRELLEERPALESELASLIEEVKRRRQEPHRFWETVGAAMKDLFGR
jgi:hypothetical protein